MSFEQNTGHDDQYDLKKYFRHDLCARMMLEKRIHIIGWDYDKKDQKVLKTTMKIAERFGKPTAYETNKGYHIKIRLEKPVTLYRSFQIRYFLGDDYHRLLRDILKALSGAKVIDVLFDVKKVMRKSILDD